MHQLSRLLQRLAEHRVEFVLVGGYAAVVHGASFVTRDVDVCLRFSTENLLRLQSALSDLHVFHRMTPQRLPFEISPDTCHELKNLYLHTDLGVLDCLGEVAGIGDFETVKRHSREIQLPFGGCLVLDLDALIKAKQAMGRPHDRLTVIQLKAVKEKRHSDP